MKQFKKPIIVACAVLILCVIVLGYVQPPKLKLFFLSGCKSYDVLWEQEEPGYYDARFYLTESAGKITTSIFVNDSAGWECSSIYTSDDLSVSMQSLPQNDDWMERTTFCLFAATEEQLQHYLDDYPETDRDRKELAELDIEIQSTVVNSGEKAYHVYFGKADEVFSSWEMIAVALQASDAMAEPEPVTTESVSFEPVTPMEAQPVDVYVPMSGRGFDLVVPEDIQSNLIQFACDDGHGIYFNEYTGRFTAKKPGRFTVVLSYGGEIQILHIQVGNSAEGTWIEGEPIEKVFSCSVFDADTLESSEEAELALTGLYFDLPERPLFCGEAYLTRSSTQGGLIDSVRATTDLNEFSHFTLFYYDKKSVQYDSIGTLMWNRDADRLLIQTAENEYIGYPADTETARAELMDDIFSAENMQ